MSVETNVVEETTESPIDLVKASRDTFLKLLACAVIGIVIFAFGAKTRTMIVAILGMAIFAGPLVLGLCFGLPIIDIGPVFHAVDTPIGNFIYRTFVPDVSGQMAANLFLTIIRAMFMLLLSVIIMPILLLICLMGYKIGRKKALRYAEANGVSPKSIPSISPVVMLIYIVVLVAGIITANLVANAIEKKYEDQYNEKLQAMTVVYEAFMDDIDNAIPEEYYAEAYNGENYTSGYIAQFKVGDKIVKCGSLKIENVIDSYGKYYIIDGVVYIDEYGTNKFTVCEDESVIETLKSRYPETHLDENMTLYDGFTGGDYDNQAMESEGGILVLIVELVEDDDDSRRNLHLDENNKLVGYGWYKISLDMTETQFVFTDKAISSDLKITATKIIEGTADVQQ